MKGSKQVHSIIIIVLILTLGVLTNSLRISIGKQTTPNTTEIKKHHDQILNISGTLLIGPNIGYLRLETIKQTSQKKIRGQVYNITEKRVKKLFQDKSQNGTNIKIIMEDKQYQQYKNYFRDIKNTMKDYPNFEIKNDRQMDTNFVHSKFFLTDTHSFIQTNNLTHAGLFQNKEHAFITNHTGIYFSLNTIFEKDRNGDKISLSDIHPNLLVCNINCRTIIENQLKEAEKSIYIQTQYITDSSIRNILQEKKEDLDLKIIVADTKNNDELKYYFPSNNRKKYAGKAYLHTKTILIDENTLIIGSINLSQNSLDKNREVAIMLTNKKLLQQYLKDFLYDRSNTQ